MNVYSVSIRFEGRKYGPTTERYTPKASNIKSAIGAAIKDFLAASGDTQIKKERKAGKKSMTVTVDWLRKEVVKEPVHIVDKSKEAK